MHPVRASASAETARRKVVIMQSTIDPKSISCIIPEGEPQAPLYRSRYGGLWVDRKDAHELLDARLARGEVTEDDAKLLAQYIDHGYVVFPKATDEAVIDEYLELFEAAWDVAPGMIYMHWNRNVIPISREHYNDVTKVSDLHSFFAHAGELIFPPEVLRFMSQIYERPPVVFQTMTMRKGSEENLHIDTGPLTLTEPMAMAASWVALEDVQPHSGEFQYVPGSHRLPELLHYGTDKGHGGDYGEYGQILQTTMRMCEERGLKTETFTAKKGDVLIWHADLMHGGAPIEDPSRTRKSLVAHFMPLGVMPTFFNCAKVKALPYPQGGYCTDRLLYDTRPRNPQPVARNGPTAQDSGPEATTIRPIDVWRGWVPFGVRKHVPPSFATWVRRHVAR